MLIGFTLVEGDFSASEGVEVSLVDMCGLFINYFCTKSKTKHIRSSVLSKGIVW